MTSANHIVPGRAEKVKMSTDMRVVFCIDHLEIRTIQLHPANKTFMNIVTLRA